MCSKKSIFEHIFFAVKQFDYNNVLELSSIVDVENRVFKYVVYYAWYMP